jgi:hypothetical protein
MIFLVLFCFLFISNITLELSGRSHGAVGADAETGTGELSAAACCYVFLLLFFAFIF